MNKKIRYFVYLIIVVIALPFCYYIIITRTLKKTTTLIPDNIMSAFTNLSIILGLITAFIFLVLLHTERRIDQLEERLKNKG